MKAVIALGSNKNQEENIRRAQKCLIEIFPNIVFDAPVWTNPVGIVSDLFLNCLGRMETMKQEAELITIFKEIERSMGDSHANHQQGFVWIDIDLIELDGRRIKNIIWQ